MAHPIVHAEIRSTDPDATRKFFADLLGWTCPDQDAIWKFTQPREDLEKFALDIRKTCVRHAKLSWKENLTC